MTSSSGETGVTDAAVGGAVSSLVLRSRAAERRVLGRLYKRCMGNKVMCQDNRSKVSEWGTFYVIFWYCFQEGRERGHALVYECLALDDLTMKDRMKYKTHKNLFPYNTYLCPESQATSHVE